MIETLLIIAIIFGDLTWFAAWLTVQIIRYRKDTYYAINNNRDWEGKYYQLSRKYQRAIEDDRYIGRNDTLRMTDDRW